MRFTFIEQHVGTFPVRLMCRVLEVSPSGFYAWRSRPESARAASDRHLLAKVHRLQAQHHGRYGSPRMHAALRAEGHSCSRGRVERMMRRHDIRALTSRGFARARPTVITPSRSPQTCSRSGSSHRRRAGYGWQISHTLRPAMAGSIWQPSLISRRARSWDGQCGITCGPNWRSRPC